MVNLDMDCDWINLLMKWLLTVIGVPTLTYIFLFAAIQQTFQVATIGWQIIIGIVLVACLIGYVWFGIVRLIEETKKCL